jgi:hypothetical protein
MVEHASKVENELELEFNLWGLNGHVPTASCSDALLTLPACRELVEAMGGEVWSAHAAKGGTILALRLPGTVSRKPANFTRWRRSSHRSRRVKDHRVAA